MELTPGEFLLMQQFIEEQCGISISEDKAYLIESRLSRLLHSSGLKSFDAFYRVLTSQSNYELIEKVIDEITTNETFWFRDSTPWLVLEEVLLPGYIDALRKGEISRVRIWSAACSTGQEPYSIAMCIDRYLMKKNITDIGLSDFELIASDISRTALEIARKGRYDNISILRGLNDEYKGAYFTKQGQDWIINDRIRNSVIFRQLNLQDNFSLLGCFDIIFCRYVIIYFSEKLKREVLKKMAKSIKQDGTLFIGSSELIGDYDESYVTELYKNGMYYKLKE